MAFFDPIPTAGFWCDVLEIEETGPINAQFNRVGFGSKYFLNNMGSLLFGFILYPIFVFMQWFLRKVIPLRFKKMHTRLADFREGLFWSSAITLIMESYAILTICCLMSLPYLWWDSVGNSIQSASTLFFFVMVLVVPAFVLLKLLRSFYYLYQSSYYKSYEGFISELDINKGRLVLIYPMMFLFRRLTLALSIVTTSQFIW